MPRSWPASAAELVRLKNLLMAAAGVAVGGFLVWGRVRFPPELAWAMASAAALGAAGNVANDLADLDADRVNKPNRPLVSGAVSRGAALAIGGLAGGLGLFAAWWVGGAVLRIALPALAVMLVYSPVFKQRGLAGNLVVAVVGSLPLVYGAAAAGWWRAGVLPASIAALLHLPREIVKDLEDVPGDRAAGRRTIPIVWGESAAYAVAAAALVLFVPVALGPWFAGWYGRRYGWVALAVAAGAAVVAGRLLNRRLRGARAALKLAMAFGLAALLWDRL
jgi:geranylgeranylglycerol-phosphate geranylgeranyltransferase